MCHPFSPFPHQLSITHSLHSLARVMRYLCTHIVCRLSFSAIVCATFACVIYTTIVNSVSGIYGVSVVCAGYSVWYGVVCEWVYALFFCFLLLFYPSFTIGLILYSSQLFGNLVVGYHWLSAVHFVSTRRQFILAVCWTPTKEDKWNDTNDTRKKRPFFA